MKNQQRMFIADMPGNPEKRDCSGKTGAAAMSLRYSSRGRFSGCDGSPQSVQA